MTVNGQQAHSEDVNCGDRVWQQSNEPWNAFLSFGLLESVYNKIKAKSRTIYEKILPACDLNLVAHLDQRLCDLLAMLALNFDYILFDCPTAATELL